MKPPFTYYGGKTRQAERIASLLPAHDHYVEPFAGSLAVLLAKSRSRMETVNDLDGELVTFWRVLRDEPEALERAMVLTPHSRAEYASALSADGDVSDVERARRVWVRLTQGRGGTQRRTGWRNCVDPSASVYGMPAYLGAYAQRVPPAAHRMLGVSLECRDALDVIRAYGGTPGVLLYCDPPYLGATRSGKNYLHEMDSDEQHRELAEALNACTAAVVLSGYPSPLYDELYAGWHRVEYKAWTGNGIAVGADKTNGARTEVLWSNRPIGAPSLFDEIGETHP